METEAKQWNLRLYVAGQTPFHAAVSRHYFDLLVASRAP